MTLILSELLNQVAVYWPIGELTQKGRRDYSSVTPIEIYCHWLNDTGGVTRTDGKSLLSTAKVMTNYAITEGGVLWLSSYTRNDPAGLALASKPSSVPTHQTVEQVQRIYSVSADEVLYEACV